MVQFTHASGIKRGKVYLIKSETFPCQVLTSHNQVMDKDFLSLLLV